MSRVTILSGGFPCKRCEDLGSDHTGFHIPDMDAEPVQIPAVEAHAAAATAAQNIGDVAEQRFRAGEERIGALEARLAGILTRLEDLGHIVHDLGELVTSSAVSLESLTETSNRGLDEMAVRLVALGKRLTVLEKPVEAVKPAEGGTQL